MLKASSSATADRDYCRFFREQLFCFLPGFTYVDRERQSTSYFHYDKREDRNFHITNVNRSWVAIYQLCRPAALASSSYNLYGMPGLAPRVDVLFSRKLLKQGYVKERLKSSLKNFYSQTIWSSSLKNAKQHSVAWQNAMTTLHRSLTK